MEPDAKLPVLDVSWGPRGLADQIVVLLEGHSHSVEALAAMLSRSVVECAEAILAASAAHGDEPPPTGRARKVSVSMPDDLTAAVQQRVGKGGFSRYVSEAVAMQLKLDLVGELAALLEAEHGPVSDELLAEASAAWPDAE